MYLLWTSRTQSQHLCAARKFNFKENVLMYLLWTLRTLLWYLCAVRKFTFMVSSLMSLLQTLRTLWWITTNSRRLIDRRLHLYLVKSTTIQQCKHSPGWRKESLTTPIRGRAQCYRNRINHYCQAVVPQISTHLTVLHFSTSLRTRKIRFCKHQVTVSRNKVDHRWCLESRTRV